jgi:hypothetical protein
MLEKVISGGQTGVDQVAIMVASEYGLKTGGIMPEGWRTEGGPNPEFGQKYGLREGTSPEYPIRTEANVRNSDGTLRIALKLNSKGMRSTMNAIVKHRRPYFDVDLKIYEKDAEFLEKVKDWMNANNIKTLNMAGDEETKDNNIATSARLFIDKLMKKLGFKCVDAVEV